MFPILFRIPGTDFPVTTFGLMVVLGFLAGSAVFARLGLRFRGSLATTREKLDAIPLWVLVGVILGARLMYVAVEMIKGTPTGQSFKDDPLSILFVFQGGLVMYGGAFGARLGGWWASVKQGLRFAHVADVGMVCCFLGLAIGRIGCLLVGDDYGRPVPENWQHLPFPFTITVPDPPPDGSLFGSENSGLKLWATQIWMSVNALVIYLVGRALLKRRRYLGEVSFKLMLLYAITRFVIESFRGDSIRGTWFDDTISTSQLISIVVALVCVVMLVVRRGRFDPDAALLPDEAIHPDPPDPPPPPDPQNRGSAEA